MRKLRSARELTRARAHGRTKAPARASSGHGASAHMADRLDDRLEIRRTGPGERAAALALLSRALDWGTDPAAERRYAWEHVENPFGETLAWAAFDGARMVGLRHFLRWEFETPGGAVVPAV